MEIDWFAEIITPITQGYSYLSIPQRDAVKEIINAFDKSLEQPTQPREEPAKPSTNRLHVIPNNGRRWAFCEAINPDGTNLIPYPSSTACWKAEIGDLKETGYTGWANANALESFKNKGWGIAFGNAVAKRKGMRVIRPK